MVHVWCDVCSPQPTRSLSQVFTFEVLDSELSAYAATVKGAGKGTGAAQGSSTGAEGEGAADEGPLGGKAALTSPPAARTQTKVPGPMCSLHSQASRTLWRSALHRAPDPSYHSLAR